MRQTLHIFLVLLLTVFCTGAALGKDRRKTKNEAGTVLTDSISVKKSGTPERHLIDEKAVQRARQKAERRERIQNSRFDPTEKIILNDSLILAEGQSLKELLPVKRKDATRASLYSALIPGWGQIYGGRQWWMAPIFWGGLGGTIYGYTFYQKYYKEFRTEYKSRIAGNEPQKYTYFDNSTLVARMQHAEQQRDLFIVYTAAVYLLNIIHANVAVQLAEFKYDKKLSLSPALINNPYKWSYQTPFNTMGGGVSLKLTF